MRKFKVGDIVEGETYTGFLTKWKIIDEGGYEMRFLTRGEYGYKTFHINNIKHVYPVYNKLNRKLYPNYIKRNDRLVPKGEMK